MLSFPPADANPLNHTRAGVATPGVSADCQSVNQADSQSVSQSVSLSDRQATPFVDKFNRSCRAEKAIRRKHFLFSIFFGKELTYFLVESGVCVFVGYLHKLWLGANQFMQPVIYRKIWKLFATRKVISTEPETDGKCSWINASSICYINLSFSLSLSLCLVNFRLSYFGTAGAVLIKSQPIIH